MATKNPYDILGVARNASQDEIKRAYRRLAKEHHPDRNPGNKSAEQRFKEIQAAYEVLGDPERRTQYDRFGAGGPPPEYQNWGARGAQAHERGAGAGGVHFDFDSFGDLNSIFEQFFRRSGPGGGGFRRGGAGVEVGGAAPRGADLEHAVEVSFEEAMRGTTREVVLRNPEDGSSERIEFRIPAGVSDGQRIRVRGKGNVGPGGRGDLIIVSRVRPDSRFRREARDLLVDLPLSFAEAALGTVADVPTLEGPMRVKVPPGTSSGARLRLRGKGVPDPRNGTAGDLFAVVQVQVPKNLTSEARRLIEQLDAELKPKAGVS
jgi:curved DNA-binding protein